MSFFAVSVLPYRADEPCDIRRTTGAGVPLCVSIFCRRIKPNVAHELPAAVDVAVAVKHPVIRQLVSKLVAVEVVPSGFRF